jgi:NADPH:quinone reductase-like Zn-dependent oxidoreductase
MKTIMEESAGTVPQPLCAATANSAFAITVVAARNVALAEIPSPGNLQPDEVRGKTLYSLMSPGTELAWNYNGKDFPNYPGYASVFMVEEIGAAVADRKPGDVVFSQGGHRSYQQLRASETIPVPTGLNPSCAPIARLMGVSMTTLMTTKARPGDVVIITGMGPIGYCAASIFAIGGYEVHVVEPNPDRRAAIGQLKIKGIHSAMPFSDESLCGKVALVVECSGHEQAALDGCKMVRKGGEVVLVGVPWSKRTGLSAHDLLHAVFHRYVHLRTGWEWELPMHETDANPHSICTGFRLGLQWLKEGKLALDGVIAIHNPAKAHQVYDDCANGKMDKIFNLFKWG